MNFDYCHRPCVQDVCGESSRYKRRAPRVIPMASLGDEFPRDMSGCPTKHQRIPSRSYGQWPSNSFNFLDRRLTPEFIDAHSKQRECRTKNRMTRRWVQLNLKYTRVVLAWNLVAAQRAISLASFGDESSRNTALSHSSCIARLWPSNSFKRMVPTAVRREPISCALPVECCSCITSCDQTWLLPSHHVSAMFAATAAKMCKHQGWQSEAVAHCIVTAWETHTQAPKETVFYYSWLLDQRFGDRCTNYVRDAEWNWISKIQAFP